MNPETITINYPIAVYRHAWGHDVFLSNERLVGMEREEADALLAHHGYEAVWPSVTGLATVSKAKSKRQQAEELYDRLFELCYKSIPGSVFDSFFGRRSRSLDQLDCGHYLKRALWITTTAHLFRALAQIATDLGHQGWEDTRDVANQIADLIEGGLPWK